MRGVVDLSSPRPGGAILVEAAGRLYTRLPTGSLRPFAAGYAAPPGLEPYLVLSSGQRVPGAGCRFAPGALYALRLSHGNGVTVVGRGGRVRRFAVLPSRGLEDGIAFDLVGGFGHQLLVTNVAGSVTTLDAIDCLGRVRVLTNHGPRVEGGLAVAPRSFGRFAGELIAPDELSGNLYAFGPGGRSVLVVRSGLASGQDTGVESEGFVPSSFTEALVADRGTRGNRHPGDDEILALSRSALAAVGVRAGDLLVVTEGGAQTIAVRCRRSCVAHHVASGPVQAHTEGHVVFAR